MTPEKQRKKIIKFNCHTQIHSLHFSPLIELKEEENEFLRSVPDVEHFWFGKISDSVSTVLLALALAPLRVCSFDE